MSARILPAARKLVASCALVACGLAAATPSVSAQTPQYTATFGSQSPNPAPPSSTVAWTVTFTRTAPSFVNIGIDLLGTSGQGTLSNFTTSAGGTCVPTGGNGFRCDWQPGDPSTAVLSFVLNVGPNATPPDWQLNAVLDDGQTPGALLASQNVVIQQPATTTTTVQSTTTVAQPSSTAAGAVPTTAAGASGAQTLPATGKASAGIVWIALALTILGGSFIAFARRRPSAS